VVNHIGQSQHFAQNIALKIVIIFYPESWDFLWVFVSMYLSDYVMTAWDFCSLRHGTIRMNQGRERKRR